MKNKILSKLVLGLSLVVWLPILGCYMLCYEIKTWSFWYNVRCYTYKDGEWSYMENGIEYKVNEFKAEVTRIKCFFVPDGFNEHGKVHKY